MNHSTNYRLTDDQVRFYADNGYLHLKQIIDPWEIARLDAETSRVIEYWQRFHPPNATYNTATDPVTGKKVLRRINNMYTKGDAFSAAWAHPRILGIAESILGPDIVPFQDAMVIKMPEYGVPVPWHRDPGNARVHPPFDADIYLDAATQENGCLYVVPGSHLWQGFDLQEMMNEHGFSLPGAVPIEAEPGDVVLHSPNILHSSKGTRGKPIRRIIYYNFFSIEELLSRDGGIDADYIFLWINLMHWAIALRSQMDESAAEIPFAYHPTKEEFAIDTDTLGYVEKEIERRWETFDPEARYSPLFVVKPKVS